MTDSNALQGKHIVLGISGGIAAFKAPALVRLLTGMGAEVQVVMSTNAHHFVTATTLQAVSGRPVRESLWDEAAEAAMGHIELARWADLILIAPASADCMAELAAGGAGELLTTLCLATTAPVAVAPAMNQAMYGHPATQRNLTSLNQLGYKLLGPASGDQACGDDGPGRMLEPEELASTCVTLLNDQTATTSSCAGLQVMITAGPTAEAIDPVRFISNHSSGRQGLALAEAAANRGAQVTLIAGPGVAASTAVHKRIDVTSALDMHAAVHAHLDACDMFIGVAAVADYRPANAAEQKMKRSGEAGAGLTLELVENPDIIASVAALESRPLLVGFAAETHKPLEYAREKRIRKGLDAIVLNDVSDPSIGFNETHNAATLIWAEGEVELPRQSKQALADQLFEHLLAIFATQLVVT